MTAMSVDEAVRICGPEVMAQIRKQVAAFPAPTNEQADVIGRVLIDRQEPPSDVPDVA